MFKKFLVLFSCIFLFSSCQWMAEEEIVEEAVEVATPEPEKKPPTPQNGGTLKLSMRNPKTLNPLLNEDITVDRILKLVFEPLFVLDESQKPVPNLARRIEFASDGLSAVITLRNDVLWSDGSSMDAYDVVFSLKTIESASEYSIYKETVENISNYSVVDQSTVKIEYMQPSIRSAYLLCFPIIPEQYYKGESDPASESNMTPVGNGLYNFASFKNVEEMNLVKNNTTFRQNAYIEKIQVLITSNAETDLYSFDQGIIDVVSSNIAEWGKYRGTKEATITEYITSYYDFIGFNVEDVILNDKRIRKAIAHAINVNEIIDNIYLGHAVRAYTPISPASWVYEPNTAKYDHSAEQARALITEAGFTDINGNGIYDKEINGIKQEMEFTILVNKENDERAKLADILKENLSDIGMVCVVDRQPFEEYERKLKENEFDIFIGGFNLSVVPDLTFAFSSSQIDSGSNYFHYSNTVMDSLLSQAASANNDLMSTASFNELQKLIAEELPCISIAFRKSAVLSDLKIGGEIKPVINNMFANCNEWFLINK